MKNWESCFTKELVCLFYFLPRLVHEFVLLVSTCAELVYFDRSISITFLREIHVPVEFCLVGC